MHPERRKHVRILTIRNFAAALLVLVLALATANVISRIRAPRSGEYGRLTLDAKPVTVHRPEVVNEAEVPDITPGGPTASVSKRRSAMPRRNSRAASSASKLRAARPRRLRSAPTAGAP